MRLLCFFFFLIIFFVFSGRFFAQRNSRMALHPDEKKQEVDIHRCVAYQLADGDPKVFQKKKKTESNSDLKRGSEREEEEERGRDEREKKRSACLFSHHFFLFCFL